jgi:F-type H+-transporting ATPase subunit a
MEIAQKTMRFLTIAMIAFFSATVFASVTDKKLDDQNDGGQVNTQKEVKDYIKHHLKDSHDFALFSYTSDAGVREHVGMALPVIIWTSEGLVTFMSSAFDHNDDGNVIVDKDGLKFAKIHSKIYELEKGASTVSFDEEEHATNAARVLDFSITKSVVGILLASVLLFFWFSRLGRQYKKRKIPIGFGRVLEPLVIYVRDEMARPNIGEKNIRNSQAFY